MEASDLLRRFVGVPRPEGNSTEAGISSHSLKATFLAWAARYGMSPSTRAMLGRHSSSLNETFAIYSRDLSIAPALELQAMIDDVCSGKFIPDGPRSHMFNHGAPNALLPEGCSEAVAVETPANDQVKDEVPDCVDLTAVDDALPTDPCDVSDSSSSDSSGDGPSSDSVCLPEPAQKAKRFRAKIPANEKRYVHKRSHIVHRLDENQIDDEPMLFLKCGKRLNASYGMRTDADAWNTLCKMCHKRN